MANKMDRGLDEIIADSRGNAPRGRRGRGDYPRRDRQEYPRDGVRKSARTESRSIDSEWVHDRFDERTSRRDPDTRRPREPLIQKGSKLRVDNIHYDLGEDDLDELFARIGPVTRLQLLYDRAGRSRGTAFVTYEHKEDAEEAIRQFHGANANGQPIRLTSVPIGPSRNAFDTAIMPGRPLAERISTPGVRSRSFSPRRYHESEDTTRRGIDRYIPESGSRPRSPMGPRRGGRRPGFRREGFVQDQQSNRGGRGNPGTKKTQEELDAEMEDYFGGSNASGPAPGPGLANGHAAAAGNDDIDMIE